MEENKEMYLKDLGEGTARLVPGISPESRQAPALLARLLDDALLTGKYHRVEALCRADDIPSVRLYESCGMTGEGTLREAGKNPDGTFCDMLLFSILERERKQQEDDRKREAAAALYREKYKGFFIRRLKKGDADLIRGFLSGNSFDEKDRETAEDILSGYAVGIFDCRGTKAFLEAHAAGAKLVVTGIRKEDAGTLVLTDPDYEEYGFAAPVRWILERHAFQSGEDKSLPPDAQAFRDEEAPAAVAIRGCSYLIMTYDFTEKVGTHYT